MSDLNDTTRLAIAELAIFIILLPIVLYILVRHGKHGLDGWAFATAFCLLRLVSAGLQIGQRDDPSATAAIINSVGISALLLSISGVVHEVSTFIQDHDPKMGWVVALLFHLATVGGIALSAVGGSNLASPPSASNDYNTAHALQKAGNAVLVVVSVLLTAYALFLASRLRTQRRRRSSSSSSSSAAAVSGALKLVYCACAACVFAVVRAAYGLAYAVTSSSDLSPVTGTFAVKLVLIFLVQLVAILFLVLGGLLARNISRERVVPAYQSTASK